MDAVPHHTLNLVRQRLLDASSEAGLDRLGIHAADRTVIAYWLNAVAHRSEDLAAVTDLRERVLLPQIGVADDHSRRPEFDQEEHELGRGVLPLCALAASADDVLAYQAQRGLPAGLGVRTLNDLGQQVSKHRRVHGEPGLHNESWLQTVWSGDFLWLGRLQFEPRFTTLGVPTGPTRRVLSVHIPQAGPLTPASVDAAFAAASQVYRTHLGHLGTPTAFICDSWLLDPTLIDLLPGTNLASFAQRWTPWSYTDGDWSAGYFAFDVDAPGRRRPNLDALPLDSTLRRRLVEHWRAGGHIRQCTGVATTLP